ncbi:chemotaxis protein CheB [Desulfuromonas sp. TF]|uniref:chemotaxis protein CheB n=1 Tax=Desulfuromonas sp. TF TaxID=1232410 RepID=UPI0004286FD3|nr:chemotaxis protein CheB [Desulfuromonas sp. TF]
MKARQKGRSRPFAAALLGGSAGGISAVTTIVSALPPSFSLPVVVVLHQSPGELGWVEYLGRQARLPVVEAEDKMPLAPGRVYCAPAGYHLLLETGGTLALSVDEKVNFARPSIDLLFSSAADALAPALIGIVLTGTNGDGARGLAEIAEAGGLAVVQSPRTAEWPTMPEAALETVPQALVVDLEEIAKILVELTM